MVAVARIMNATLVIPQLDKRSFWQDSRFSFFFTSKSGLHHLFFFFLLLCWVERGGRIPIPLALLFFFFFFLLLIITSLFLLSNSTFTDIFDERHFISTLRGDVRIVKQLPKELESASRARKHFTTWSSMSYYEEMTQLWRDYQVLFIRK